MRKAFLLASLIVLLLMPLLVTNVASSDVNEIADATYISITAEEAKRMMDEHQSIVILDVRTAAEYKSGHIAGAESLPLSEMGCAACLNAFLDKYGDKALLVYCKSGIKSEDACNILVNHVYEKVYKMIGGLNAWENAGFPVVAGSTSSEIDDILSSGKSVFLFLYVDWCHFCQQQMPIIDELEQEYAEKIAFVRINCEEHPNAMKEFGARGYPAMFLILGKADDGQYESQDLRGFTDKETLKESIYWIITNGSVDASISLSGLKPLMFRSVTSATDLCDTNPSACQCSQATCNKACLVEELGLYTWQDAVRYGMEIGICVGDCTTCVASEGADGEACSSCLQCVIDNTATPASCIGACSGDPCSYGYECTPCSPWLPYTKRCSDHTREALFCQCDGQDWYWSELACPSGKSCCVSNGGVVCVDLQTDSNNCGECGKTCGVGESCENGECFGDGCCKFSSGCISGYLKVSACTDSGGSFYIGQKCCGNGNCYECCTDDDCQEGYICNPETHECEEEVPEFPAGVTIVFGATIFIFLMMRRKYVRK